MQPLLINFGTMKMNLKKYRGRIEDLEEKMQGLLDKPPVEIPDIPEGASFDMSQLASMFASKKALADLETRLASCETKNDQQDTSLTGHSSRLDSLESLMKTVNDKIKNLNNVPAMPVPTGEIDTAAVMAIIQKIQSDLADKADRSLVATVDKNTKELGKHGQRIDVLETGLNDLRRGCSEVEQKVNGNSREIDRLNSYIEILQKQLKGMNQQP